MSDTNPTLKDIWRLLGTMNKRFDALEREAVDARSRDATLKAELVKLVEDLRSEMRLGFGALREQIEARDFRLDDHGRRISELERRT